MFRSAYNPMLNPLLGCFAVQFKFYFNLQMLKISIAMFMSSAVSADN